MKDLTKGNIYKTFLLFAIPLILAGFLSQAYSIADTIIAGKILGADGLAAIGSTSAFIQLISSVFWGYSAGFSIYLAMLFGAREYKRLKTAIYMNILFISAAAILLCAAAVLFQNPIFDWLAVDQSIRADASIYFTIYILGGVFIFTNTTGVYIMNALGSSSYPMIMSVISMILNIGGNLFTVLVLKMGIGGLAAASVFSAAVIDICYAVKIRKSFKEMGVDKYRIKFEPGIVKKTAVYSFPTMIQQMFMYLASTIVSPMVNGIGSAASAAYVICLKVYDTNATVFQNSSKSVSNYIAQSIGAGKYENIRRGLRVGFLQGFVFTLPVLVFTVVCARSFCSVFLPSGSAGDSLNMAVVFAKYFMPFALFNLVNNLFHSFYRGVAAMKLLVAATFIGAASSVIATYFAVKLFAMNGVYLGWVISWFIETAFSIVVYFMGAWQSESIRKHLTDSKKGVQ